MTEAITLESVQAQLATKPPELRAKILAEAVAATRHLKFIPNVGAQLDAYNSKADVLLFGGEPGGSKTALVLGLALNLHTRSLILRRRYTDLGALSEELIKFNGTRTGYNGAPPPSLRTGNKLIELGAANSIGDEQSWMGQPHDLLALDEATQFAESQVRFLMGWVRSSDPKQRCRVVMATNPPLTSEGQWVIKMFAPWLDETYPNPAKPGELRWVVSDDDGDRWVDGPEPVALGARIVKPTSRTFIPSKLTDNPFLKDTDYQSRIDALPETIRTILTGGFKVLMKDAQNQLIPTAWIREAQKRWTPNPPQGVPMCALGVDCSGGGDDPLVVAARHDGWFAPIEETKGKVIPKNKAGSFTAAIVMTNRRNACLVVLDMGGGYGGACYQMLRENNVEVRAYRGSEKSIRKTKERQMPFFNVRSEAYWRFREALDPDQDGGSPIALPEDPELVADLTAPRQDMNWADKGIKVEAKEDIIKRLGRSTNRADAVVMAWFDGPRYMTDGKQWAQNMPRNRMSRPPQVIMGRQHRVRG